MKNLVLISLLTTITNTMATSLKNGIPPRHFASDPNAQITLHSAEVSGNGCDESTTSAVISPDGQELSVIFDDMILEQTVSSKKCYLDLNILVPQGFQVALTQVDYRGYVFLDQDASARINTTTNLFYPKHNRSMPKLNGQYNFSSGTDEDYFLSQDTTIRGMPQFSACSQPITIKTKTEIRVRGELTSKAFLSVDSTDFSMSNPTEGLHYQLVWKKCARSAYSPTVVSDRYQRRNQLRRGSRYRRNYRR